MERTHKLRKAGRRLKKQGSLLCLGAMRRGMCLATCFCGTKPLARGADGTQTHTHLVHQANVRTLQQSVPIVTEDTYILVCTCVALATAKGQDCMDAMAAQEIYCGQQIGSWMRNNYSMTSRLLIHAQHASWNGPLKPTSHPSPRMNSELLGIVPPSTTLFSCFLHVP